MAVASWMLRNRNNITSGRFNRNRVVENDEDAVKLDLNKDPTTNAQEILSEITKSSGITEGRRANYLNALNKLFLHVGSNFHQIAYNTEEILCCLRVTLVSESTIVRCAGLKAIRPVLRSEDDVKVFNRLRIPFLVARSLDLTLKNDVERIQALSLVRKILFFSPRSFEVPMAKSLISVANCGIEEKDRMLRACLACLSELGVLNAELFILSGGVAAITRNLLECQTPRIAESLCGVLLLLLDRPITRNHAAIDLHCIAAPYCDFHYRHGWMDKNRDERELRFNCSRLALLSVLRSWPGILHFCSPSNSLGLKAIVDILYLNQLEVRKAVLDLLYELLGLPQPEWTDELSVALSAVDPAEPQAAWRLSEGFVAAEGRSVLPHLARTTPSITDIHIALLLYCFLENGLLGALAEVIATSDTFISVRATVLLGELLRLVQILLPPECCNVSPALPNLLEYAVKRPQALAAVSALQQLHKLLKRRPASSSLYLDYVLQSGSFMKRSRTTEHNKKCKLSHSRSRFQQLVLKEGDDIIRDTGVLISKDAFTWNWNIIKIILRGESDFKFDLSESTHVTFLKRLVEFYMPSKNRYSHMDLAAFKNTQGYTTVGIELIYCLVRMEDAEGLRLLVEMFRDISNHVAAITTSKSSHDCLFSPQHMSNTQCQSYFLFVGRFGSTRVGVEVLNSIKMFAQLQHLATTTKHDCYVKLIVSSLDYQHEGSPSREVLAAILRCSNESSRLYATQFLQMLLRVGLPQFSNWGIKLLTTQLDDKSRTVHLTALAALHEASESPDCLEHLIKLQPNLLPLGEKGVLLLIRFLSVPSGFNALKKNDFVVNEIKRWDDFFNFRYVRIIEGEVSDTLTLHQRGEDGRYDKRLSSLKVTSRKDLFFPPHLYGELAKHSEGFLLLLEHGSIDRYLQCLENGLCETEEDILNLKVSLWTLGHLGASIKGLELLNNKGSLAAMVRLAQHCVIYSIRATAFFTLALVATTRLGADSLFKLGWVCTRHDRHNYWPVIEEENWQEDHVGEQPYNAHFGSDSEHTSSDHAFAGDFFVNIPDADSTTTDEDFPYVERLGTHQKSSTLPCNQNPSSVQHKRSLSESKTFDELKMQADRRHHEKVEFRLGSDVPHRYRDNSVTESTTSGVSSCESVLGKISQNERVHTLSPIPSSSSLSTLKTSGVRMRRHSESVRRVSLQSTTPSDRSTISLAGSVSGKLKHQDMVGYAILRSLRTNRIARPLHGDEELSEFFAPESLINFTNPNPVYGVGGDNQNRSSYGDFRSRNFRNTYLDNMSLTSLSSVHKFSIKEDAKNTGQIYMGICLPRILTDLFPDNQVVSRRLSLVDKNDGLEEGVLDSGSSKSEVNYSNVELKSRRKRFAKHDTWSCLGCSRSRRRNSRWSGSETIETNSIPNHGNSSSNDLELRWEILKEVERLSNPVWIKPARLSLLHHKQQHPHLFRDVCLYSDICKMIGDGAYRLGPRRLLHELFLDTNYDTFYEQTRAILTDRDDSSNNPVDARHREGEVRKNTRECRFDKTSYLNSVAEQRKAELSKRTNSIRKGYPANKHCSGTAESSVGSVGMEGVSPARVEPRSPPLSCVMEEGGGGGHQNSAESGDDGEGSRNRRNTFGGGEGEDVVAPSIKTLDSLNLTYSQNKFPIRCRSKSDPKRVIK